MTESKCKKCEGCGYVADTEDQEPWSAWLDLPVKSALGVFGLVYRIECPACCGTGYGPEKHDLEEGK